MRTMDLRTPPRAARPPYGSLAVAFFGILGYAAAQAAAFDPSRVSAITHLSTSLLASDLPMFLAASTAIAFAGLLGALWGANRATGRGAAAGSGLALGSLGVLTLVLAGDILPYLLQHGSSLVPSLVSGDAAVGTAVGTILSFLGLALLCAGLAAPAPAPRALVSRSRDYVSEGPPSALDTLDELLESQRAPDR